MAYGYDPTLSGWAWPDDGAGLLDPTQTYGLVPPANAPASYYGYGDPNLAGSDPDEAIRQALGPEIADNLTRLIHPPLALTSTSGQTTGDPNLDGLIYGVRNAGLNDASGSPSQTPPDGLSGLSGPQLADLIRQLPTSSISSPADAAATTPPQIQ